MKKGKKVINKNLFVGGLFSFSLVCSTIGFALFAVNSLNSTSTTKISNHLDSNAIQQDTNSNAVIESINGFNDYNVLNSSNLIAPIVTTQGAVGTTKDNKSLTLTTFDGILVWNKIFANDSSISTFYKQNYPTQNVSELVIKNYIYLPSVDVIAVLLGSKDSNTNESLFGINMGTGTLYNPLSVSDNSNIVKINEGVKYLFLNSSGSIIATKGNTYNDYVNSQYISMNNSIGISSVSMVISKDTANSQNDYLMTFISGQKGVNFAVFLSNTTTSSDNQNNNNSRQVYVVAVDDYANPILNNNARVTFNVGTYIPKNGNDVKMDDILTYQPSSFNFRNPPNMDFFVIISGKNSSLRKISYNSSTKTFTDIWNYSNNDVIFDFFSFNTSTNRVYIANKKSRDGYATGYIDLSAATSNLKFTPLEIDKTSNWNQSTFEFTNVIKEIPIISSSTLSVPDPYIILKEGQEPIAKYFVNSSDIQNKPLLFKNYKDPVTTFKSSYASVMKGLASKVNDSNLIGALNFNSSSDATFKPSISIVNKSSNDKNGTLSFNYQVSYQNWYSTNTTYTFKIAAAITGFYATSNINFNWITGLTGDPTNDSKWKEILKLKSSKYSYEITKDDIVKNFATLSAKGNNGATISLNANMVTLKADSSGYSLTVTINFASSNIPPGVQTSFTQSYSGFKTISGYDYKVSDTPVNDLSSIYPSQLTLSIFLNNFVSLGSKWSKSDSDWTYNLDPDNLNGTATVTLTYKLNDKDFPTGTNKTIVTSKTFSGFNSVPKQFKSGLSINTYNGILDPTDLWTDYQKNPSTSVLFSSLKFPYINNNNNLDIECTNLNSANNDGFLTLKISIKLDTSTSLYIPNYGQFIYDSNAQNVFKNQKLDTFTINWMINKVEQKFEWKDNVGNIVDSNSNSIQIDLTNESYDGINKTMYANQVSEDAINKLFNQTGYIVDEVRYSNVSQGTLTIVLNLKVEGTQDSTTGTTQTKTILITGFKVPLLSSTSKILFTFIGVMGFFILLIVIFLLIYTKRKAVNYKYKKINPKRLKKIRDK